ncbi:MAG: hypothetical protein AAGC83_02690 [Pseudomonadota bacterium]
MGQVKSEKSRAIMRGNSIALSAKEVWLWMAVQFVAAIQTALALFVAFFDRRAQVLESRLKRMAFRIFLILGIAMTVVARSGSSQADNPVDLSEGIERILASPDFSRRARLLAPAFDTP